MNRILLLISVFLILNINLSYADDGARLIGARSAALGESAIALNDFWSAINYQSGLALLDQINIGITAKNRFSIKELSAYGLAINIPTKNAGFGFSISQYGTTNYSETILGIGYGMKLGSKFVLGVQMNYIGLKQGAGYPSISTLFIEGGFQYQLNQDLNIVGHIFNPGLSSNRTFYVAEIYQLGFSYQAHNNAVFLMSIKYHSLQKISLHTGIEFKFKTFRARLGYASKAETFTFGLGYYFKNLSVDISSSIHSYLGKSPQISLCYEF